MMDWLMERLMPELKQHLDVSVFCCCMLPAVHAAFPRCLALLMHQSTFVLLQVEFLPRYMQQQWVAPSLSVLAGLHFQTTSETNLLDTLHELEPRVRLFLRHQPSAFLGHH